MARFILTPCRIREDRIVPSGDAVEMDWPQLVAAFAPSRTLLALNTLTRLRASSYVGLLKGQGNALPTNFFIQNDNKTNVFGWLFAKRPDIPERVECVYRVDEALFDAKIEESSSGAPA